MSLSVSVKEIVDKTNNTLLSVHPNWLRVSIEDICVVLNGYAFKSTAFNNKKIGMPLIRIRDVQESSVETYYSGDYPKEYVIKSGDILVGMDGDFNCKKWNNIPALLNQRVCKIEIVSEYFHKDFLFYALPPYLTEINQWTSAVTVKHLSSFSIKEIPLPLPPLNEQKRIVAKLDAIMPRIEAVKARLDKVPDILKRFRQSVLTAAVTGKLTEQWREEHPEVGSAEDCLKILINKRMSDFNQQILTAKINKLPKPQIPNYLNYSFDRDTEKNNELPTTWIISKVGLLCDCIVPGRDKPKSFTGSIPWITLPNISGNELNNHSGILRLSDSEIKEVNARVIPKQSVVMCCVGNFGISAVVNDPIVINQQLHAFVKSEIIISKYLMYHLKTLKEYQESIATSTTIAYLNKTNCNVSIRWRP